MDKDPIPGYQENFEGVLKDANLQGKSCRVVLLSGVVLIGRMVSIDTNYVKIEHENALFSYIRPQAILAVLTEEVNTLCPWCNR